MWMKMKRKGGVEIQRVSQKQRWNLSEKEKKEKKGAEQIVTMSNLSSICGWSVGAQLDVRRKPDFPAVSTCQ